MLGNDIVFEGFDCVVVKYLSDYGFIKWFYKLLDRDFYDKIEKSYIFMIGIDLVIRGMKFNDGYI